MKTKFYLKSEGFKLNTRMSITKLKEDKLELFSPLGGNVSFQMVVASDERSAINISKEPFISHDLETSNVRIEAKAPFDVTLNHIVMANGSNSKFYADALVCDYIIEKEMDIPHSIFFSVDVPADFKEKSFEITINAYGNKIFTPEKLIYTKTLVIEVINYTMPKPKDYKLFLDLWQHNTMMARVLKLPVYGEEHFALIEKYIKTLADLGQKAITAIVSEAPWSGQRCFVGNTGDENLFEYSMVSVKKTSNGYVYNYDILDRYIKLCMDNGIDKEIEIFGLTGIWLASELGFGKIAKDFIEGIRIRYEDLDGTFKYIDKGNDIVDYIKAIEKHFMDNGLINIVKVIADEPADKELFKKSLKLFHEITPNFKYKSALDSAGFLEEVYNDINDFAPSFQVLCKEYKRFTNKIVKKEDNKKYLWYVCLTPEKPNTFVYSDAIDSRIIGLLTYLFKADGFLRWSYYGFLKDPIACSAFRGFPAGDCNIVYFNKTGTPALSLRYKALKRGIEDYELIMQLVEQGKEKELEKAFEMMLTPKRYQKLIKEMDASINGTKASLDMPATSDVSYIDYDNARKYMLNLLSNN